jgi:hypothetical protein
MEKVLKEKSHNCRDAQGGDGQGLAGAAPAEEEMLMKKSPFEERRSSYRLPFVSPFVCRTVGGDLVVSGRLYNVSITGCYGVLESPLPVGTSCSLHIIFQGDHSRLNVEGISSRIIRSSVEGVAVRFDQRLEWFVLIPLFYQKICGDLPRLPEHYLYP